MGQNAISAQTADIKTSRDSISTANKRTSNPSSRSRRRTRRRRCNRGTYGSQGRGDRQTQLGKTGADHHLPLPLKSTALVTDRHMLTEAPQHRHRSMDSG